MNCGRCQGLMISDRFVDLEETGHLWMTGWRCMNCGHVVDHVTQHNRKLQAQGLGDVATVKRTVQHASKLPKATSAHTELFHPPHTDSRAVSITGMRAKRHRV
jgi:hypothetical protein